MVELKLKNLKTEVAATASSQAKQDSSGRTYGTGRRKSAVARVWVKMGSGKFVINKRSLEEYFPHESLHMLVNLPFTVINMLGKFDVFCTVKGGGHSGQAGAVRLGIARAVDKFDSVYHSNLRKNGLLTRDARVVERKKYGKHKARKSTQFSKR